MPIGSIASRREVLHVNDLIALQRPLRPPAPLPAQERSLAVAPPPPWVPQRPPANLPPQAAASQAAAPQSTTPQAAPSDLASMPGLLNLTGSGGGGAAALFADTPGGGAPAAAPATVVLQPGGRLLLLGTLPPDTETVGPFAAPPDPTPAAPPPTASPEQIALVELLLGDPLMVEVIAAYGPTAPTALPPNATTDALVAQYGHDLTCRMLQASGAITGLLNEYLRAMDRAAQHGPDAGGPGWVFTPGTPVQGEQDGRAAKWHFDPTLFTADYARGDSLAARAFASLHGQDGGFATITRTLNATTESGEIHTTTSGGIDLDSARFTLQDVGDAGSALHWEGARIGSHALAQVDLDAPPEMFDPTAVWFDPALGLVTSNANLVPEDSWAETVVITVVIGVVTWGIGTAVCTAYGISNAVATGAIMGGTSAVIGGLFQNGTVSFDDVVRGAVTGALTAAVAQNLDSWGVDPQTKAITDWGARAGAATGKATVQGILAELTGGKFKDAFGPAFASSLAADVGRNIDAAIAKAARGGDLNPEQVSAYRTLGRAVTTAIGALGDPDEPLAGFAQDFLGDMLKEEITLRAGAGTGAGAGTNEGGAASAATAEANPAHDAFRRGELLQQRADELDQQWIAQSDAIQAARLGEVIQPPTAAQMAAMQAGAGPLTAQAAQAWIALTDEPIGPAANGRPHRPSRAQVEASAALRTQVAQVASDFWHGTGQFAPTAPGNGSLISAVTDTGRAAWNLGVDVLSLAEQADPLAGWRRSLYGSIGIDIPAPSSFRATYDTPAFGLAVEGLLPFVPAGRLLGAPRSLGGAAFVDGLFVHDLKPLSNLELYGQAATRTPDEALQLLQRVGHDPEVLSQYRIVKLSDEAYSRRVRDLGFEFDATYGNVPSGATSVWFNEDIASKMADGTLKIPIYVRKEVFDSDEALVQILSHEISETQELRYLTANRISTSDYKHLVRPDRIENLHWNAVQDGDYWLRSFRNMFAEKN
jgi:hypothetical protein